MRVLTFSSLFPNNRLVHRGLFVRQRLLQLREYCNRNDIDLDVRVVAPVPWFPFKHELFGQYAELAAVTDRQNYRGLEITHPRFPVVPKIGMAWGPELMFYAVRSHVRRLRDNGFDFDLIDAHYFYPDGVAAVMLGQAFGRPVVITGRGTDLNLIPQYRVPAKKIRWAAGHAAGVVTVAEALTGYLEELGVERERVTVLRNGVDLDFFSPAADRQALRTELGVSGRALLSAGVLWERKGHHLVIEAVARLANDMPDLNLLIAGKGEEEHRLKALVDELGLAGRVKFLGFLEQAQLRTYMQAADALVLASSREGWANVLLESMGCGTPVAATAVDGTPEVVREAAGGVLIPHRDAETIAASIKKLFVAYPDRQETRRYAEKFSWDETSAGQLALFESILEKAASSRPSVT
jgi:glycosyltransferase involved in cell wall biosynthesis